MNSLGGVKIPAMAKKETVVAKEGLGHSARKATDNIFDLALDCDFEVDSADLETKAGFHTQEAIA